MLKNIQFCKEDTRVQRHVLPQKILLTKGSVSHPEYLLRDRSTQVNTYDFVSHFDLCVIG